MAKDLCRVMLTGRLTRDPELKYTPGGTAVADLRLAWTSSRKDGDGNWTDKPNYIDVTVWGRQAEVACEYLAKGRGVAIDGRLDWREWEAQDGSKRQAISVVCENLKFLDKPEDGGSGGGSSYSTAADAAAADGFVPSGANVDDDIPF